MTEQRESEPTGLADSYGVIVVGGGHAGCEAAAASARMGCRTLLLTLTVDNIAALSCNPAVGGVAKGHVVREVDALGGLMGEVADATAIQFRLLNRGKGPAVRSPRAQCDRRRYPAEMRSRLERIPNLFIRQAHVSSIETVSDSSVTVRTSTGKRYRAHSLVITAGTFLGGLIHIGDTSLPGGRIGEPPAIGLTASIESHALTAGRMKTGTPPRLLGSSIDFSRLTPQPGDDQLVFFSFRTTHAVLPQLPCWHARTTLATHDLIRRDIELSPVFSGKITSGGPRYCPSIEVKLVRFADKDSHLLFLEPEGLGSDEFYLNGFSTALPEEVQERAVRTIEGLEHVWITRPGYAIEYDYFEPTHLRATLESRVLPNVWFAGQVNGTSGYEEAAGQGILAGANAALRAQGKQAVFTLSRSQAYIGVMIDDLITRGAGEPYRLFTARAEHRLLLRNDNCYERLMGLGRDLGLVSESDFRMMESRWEQKREILAALASKTVDGASLLQVLRRPGSDPREVLAAHPDLAGLSISDDVLEAVEVEARYAGYIQREAGEAEKQRKAESLAIGEDIDYFAIQEISFESREKLSAVRPTSIGQASRIPGVSPADISVLLVRRKAGTLPRLAGEGAME